MLFPEIDALFGVPAPAKWHPEIDTGIHTLMTLSMAAMLSPEVDVRFSTLCHDLGKGLTPKELWPRHHGHGPAGVKLVEGLCQRLRVPNDIRDLAKLVAEFHDLIHTFPILKPATIVRLFDNIDARRKPQRVEQIALTSEADVRGRTGFEASDYPQGRLLREAWDVAKAVPTKEVVEAGFKGPEIREELTKRRIDAVAAWKENVALSRKTEGGRSSEEDHVHGSRDDKAVDRERNKRNTLNQLQEGFDGDQRHNEGGDKAHGEHRNVTHGQEADAL